MSGNILVLGAVALIVLLVGFGFLLGLLRGFRKSLFFTIVFIAVVILSFIFATALAKSVYGGSTLWRVAKGVLPESIKEGSEGVHSLKEFIRFYIEKHYTEVLDNGMTAGQSIVANENAMGIIDGLIVMILKIVMLIGCYIFLSIIFYILFGLIYLLFLRPKTYIETTTTTDEDGNETVEEKEVKPNKKRLLGGLIGGAKGFVKAMIILIPVTFMIGMAAQIEIPKGSSSTNNEIRLENGSKNSTLEDIINACKTYDSSIGKVYCGLDDFVMDKIISYDVKGADGKKVKVTVRKEINGFIDIYNVINEEIGIANIKDYDFKNNLNSEEMKKVVEAITTNISNSNATTTLLTAVGEEASVILKSEASKKDSDMALIFEELNLKGKDNKWWKDQIAQLNDIYVSFTEMQLDLNATSTKDYNLVFAHTTSAAYEEFVDEIFNNELLEMLIDGSLKYAVKKLPENLSEVQETTNQVVEDKEVNEELKAFSKLIDIIRDDIQFKDGSVDTDSLTIRTLNHIIDTEILVQSKIVGKLTTSLVKNAVAEITYNGELINYDKTIFDAANFSIHNELKSMVNVLTDGFGNEYSLGNLKDFQNTAYVENVCGMLDSESLDESKICHELFSKLLPMVLTVVTPTEDYTGIEWKNEYPSMSGILEHIYGKTTLLSEVGNFDFDSMTYRKLDNLEKENKVWNGVVISKVLNGVALPFIEAIDIDGTPLELDYNKENIIWRNEIRSIVKIGLWSSDVNGEIDDADYNNSVNSITTAFGDELKVIVLKTLGEEVQETKQTELLHAFANSAIKQLLGEHTDDSRIECPVLSEVSVTMAEGEGNLMTIKLSKFDNLTEIKTATVDSLEINTYKSKYLMYIMSDKLNEPMNTPAMVDWTSAKWEYEMPRIGEVLKTLANDDDAIVIAEIQDNMDENSEIKRITFERIEDNIAYSEALENMFAKTLEDALKDEEENPYTFPTPPAFDEENRFNAWWYAEITGLLNIIYRQMGDDNTLKLSDFNDTETVKVKVMKELYAKAMYVTEEDGVMVIVQKRKDYDCNGVEVMQQTNMGVSEYLQYLFKPQLQNVSRRSTVETDPAYNIFYDFTPTYNWDSEMQPILNLFLGTQMTYDSGSDELIALNDEDDVTFGDVFFGLYDEGSILKEGSEPMTGSEAAKRNKTRLNEISLSIDGITYLQFVLSPEMLKIMSADYTVEGHKPDDWSNTDWIREMDNLFAVGDILITAENPKMKNLDFYNLDNSTIELICNKVKSSYILQSKMALPLVNAGINNDDVNTASLTETNTLMTYIINYEWNDGINEAYEAVMDTFYNKMDAFKAMKNNYYDIVNIDGNPYLVFFEEEEKINTVCKIRIDNGASYDASDNSFLTEDGSTKLNAVKSYAEYNLMIEALKKSGNSQFYGATSEIVSRANNLEVTE